MKITPFNPLYLKGFNDGRKAGIQEGKEATIDHFIIGFEKLQKVKGIGPKTIQKMIEAMELPIEEKKVEK